MLLKLFMKCKTFESKKLTRYFEYDMLPIIVGKSIPTMNDINQQGGNSEEI